MRANARKCARESEEEMKKNCFLDTEDTKVEDAIFWTIFGLKSGDIGLQTFITEDDAFKFKLVLWL